RPGALWSTWLWGTLLWSGRLPRLPRHDWLRWPERRWRRAVVVYADRWDDGGGGRPDPAPIGVYRLHVPFVDGEMKSAAPWRKLANRPHPVIPVSGIQIPS